MKIRPPNAGGIAVGVLLMTVLGAGVAVAQAKITSADIQDETIQSKDVKNGTLTSGDIKDATITAADIKQGTITSGDVKDGTLSSADIKNGTVASGDILDATVASADIKQETITSGDIAANTIGSSDVKDGNLQLVDFSADALDSLTGYSGPNWSIIDRNVILAGDAFLRAGPNELDLQGGVVGPPLGVGSLGIRTGSADSKASFGNQVDFGGDLVTDLTAVSYSVFTTSENFAIAPNNLPSIIFEINPHLEGVPAIFSSMTFVPDAIPPGWTDIDATLPESGRWGLTGNAIPADACPLSGSACSFADLLAVLDDGGEPAVILTASISKGRDNAFSGAVDKLVINTEMFDFEPTGVITTTTP